MHKWGAAAASLSLMVAIAANAGGLQDAAPASTPNLIVYRDYAEPRAWSPTVKVDGTKIVAIGQKQYTTVTLAPGRHRITLTWPLMATQRGAAIDIDLSDGKLRYLEVTGVSRVVGLTGNGYLTRTGSGIEEVDPVQAAKTIAECCKLKAPK